MGVDREGGYAISFLTRAGRGGITRVKGDRVCLLASDLAIIPCSARAGNMSSLFTSELRLTTLSPAGSENHFILEGAADGVALVPRGQRESGWQLSKRQRVAYAPGVPNCTPGTD